jgi:LPS-assembly lipoprotein
MGVRFKVGTGGWRSASRAMLALTLAAPLLAGCGNGGFRPLYGASGIGANAEAKLAQVSIATIPGRVGQQIRNELIFQATGGGGEVQQPTMKLEVAIRESVTSTLVRTDGDSSSQIYNIEAKFQLVRVTDNTVVMSGTSYGRASFERFNSIFSNVRAREDAETRAAKAVAEDLKARLSAHLAGSA